MNILQITSSGAKLCDEHGDSAGVALGFSLGQHLTLEFDLRSGESVNGTLAVYNASALNACRSFYFALSNVWNAAATPLFLRTSGISVATRNNKTILSVELPDTGVASLVSALSGRSDAVFTCEIGGIGDDARAIFVWQFQVTIHNRIYLGNNVPESISGDPAYLTAAQVRALLGEGTYLTSDSIAFTGGTSPTAAVKIHDESPIYIEAAGMSYSGLQVRCGEGCKLYHNNGTPYIGVDYDTSTLTFNDDGNLSAKTFRNHDTYYIASGTVAVAAWTRYTGTCNALTITSIENSTQESELVVTFAGTATAPGITFPVGTHYVGSLPACEAGKSYLVNIRSGIVVVTELKSVEVAQ